MSHVAFETNAQASKALHAASARSSQTADRGTSSSFDSLIDDSLPAPAEAHASARDDQSPRPDRAKPSKSADRPDRGSRSDDRPHAADAASDAPAKANAAETKGKVAQDAKESQESQESKDVKADGDAETAGADTVNNAGTDNSADAAAVATNIAAQTPAAVALTVTVAAANTDAAQPAADDGTIATGDAQKAQLAGLAALQAQAGGKIDGKIDGKSDGKAAPKSDAKSDKADAKADAGKATPLTPDELEAAAKAQGSGEADTDSGEHAQGKSAAETTRRGATPDPQTKIASDDSIATPKVTADITQTTLPQTPAQQAQAHTAVAAAAPASAPAPQEPAVPLNGVGIEIASKAQSGKNQFDIRLDPPELGRIHVRLDVDHKGNVITHMVADRTDTLDMLRRDSASLERALQDAGLKTSDNGMQFSLRDQSANQQQSGSERGAHVAHIVVEDDQIPAAIARDYGRMGARAGGLDIKV